MPNSRNRNEATCHCSAYPFPHRLGGGVCSGTDWLVSYKTLVREECNYCNHDNKNLSCDVIEGKEPLSSCPAVELAKLKEITLPLPLTEAEYYALTIPNN
jgi:hypothetical protein